MLSAITAGLALVITPMGLLSILGGVLCGIFVGVMPGLSSVMGMSIMLPVALSMKGNLGVLMMLGIFCGSIYGNTENAAEILAARLAEKGVTGIAFYDVSHTHVSELVAEAFRCSHLVFASVTYNLGIYPVMHDFLMHLKALNFQNRTCAIIENGSWAVKSGDLMQKFLEDEMKNMTVLNDRLTLASALHPDKAGELDALAGAIIESMAKK